MSLEVVNERNEPIWAGTVEYRGRCFTCGWLGSVAMEESGAVEDLYWHALREHPDVAKGVNGLWKQILERERTNNNGSE